MPAVAEPAQDRERHELGAVVAAERARRAVDADELGEHLDHARPSECCPATSIASASRVYSSITVRHLSCWPFAHASKTKSYAQT